MPGKEKYQARKNDENGENDSSKKALKTGAKAAATAVGSPAAGKAVDAISKTKLGDKVFNKGAEALNKIPGVKKATKKLDDSGALDKADQVVNIAAANPQGAADAVNAGASSTNSLGKPNLKDSLNPFSKKNAMKEEDEDDPEKKQDQEEEEEEKQRTQTLFNLFKKPKVLIPICVGCFAFIVSFALVGTISSASSDGSGKPGSADTENNSSEGGSCVYLIKGATNGQTSVRFNEEISNLKVRLMHSSFCDGTDNVPIEGEDLIDFETYILGVVYGEIGGGINEEHAKVQAIAARSFILDRAIRGGNKANGVKLEKEAGGWVLQVRNCVADQVFCNPNLGCSKNGSSQYHDLYSGVSTRPYKYKDPIGENAKTREWVGKTAGQVLVDSRDYIVGANYASNAQNEWQRLSTSYDYKQILLQTYGSNKDIKQMNCTSSGKTNPNNADYASWKQYGESWSSIRLGNSSHTIKSAGCLVTSISMLIAKSGVPTNVNGSFNPGTFVQKLNSSGGFSGALLQWTGVSSAAPRFQYQGNVMVKSLSKSEKARKISELLSQGYYVVAEVKGGGGSSGSHWVAIDSIDGEVVTMMDPGSQATDMWKQYGYKNTSRLSYFRVS